MGEKEKGLEWGCGSRWFYYKNEAKLVFVALPKRFFVNKMQIKGSVLKEVPSFALLCVV